MKNYLQTFRNAALLMFSAIALCGFAANAEAQEASTTYRGIGRDPFVKYKPPVKRKAPEKKVPLKVEPPSIQERIERYKAQKLAAMNAQQAAPKPTTALLLSEFQVTGIFRTPRGYAAMVEATPIKLSYVVYPGEQFFDGMLVAIEETRLVFRKKTRWTDGRTETAVDTKPLRQPNAVTDSLTAQRAERAPSAPAAEEKKSEVTALVEALKALAAAGSQQPQGGQETQGAPAQGRP